MLGLSRLTFFLGCFFVAAASFSRPVMLVFKKHFGETAFVVVVFLVCAAAFVLVVRFFYRYTGSILRCLPACIVLVAGIAATGFLRITEERLHVYEYGLLAWLACRDIAGLSKSYKRYAQALALAVMFGLLDEGFQRFLPYRYFEWSDVLLNIYGCLWGGVIYFSVTSYQLSVTRK